MGFNLGFKGLITIRLTLYKAHLQAALEWGKSWYLFHKSIKETINRKLERKYKILEDKLNKLVQSQKQIINHNINFYPYLLTYLLHGAESFLRS